MSDKNLILVVDDEEDIREILGMQIEELEFEWIGAPNGQEALEILKTEPVDVVISDVTMPKMNGIDFLRNCRLNGYEYPFIVLTGNGTKNTAMEALRLGAFDFLEKPFDPSHMKSLFADAMKSSKEQQSSSGEPTSADTPKKSSDLRLPVHEESSSWEKGENLAEFIESYANQMAFCKASVKGLVKKSQVPIELGYLYRVMRSLASNSRYWSLYDLSSLSHELTENLLYFRTNPDYLNKDNIQTISNALNSLINVFSALKQSSGNNDSTTVDLVEEDDEMLKAV
jgi:YesN/AraC family two-component response regulator